MTLSTLQSWCEFQDEISCAQELSKIHKNKLASWQLTELANIKSYKAICLISPNKRTDEQNKILADTRLLFQKNSILLQLLALFLFFNYFFLPLHLLIYFFIHLIKILLLSSRMLIYKSHPYFFHF